MRTVLDLQPGAAGFQLSNPPVLQCMLLKASLNVFSQTSMDELTAKSRILTGYLELLLETFLSKKSRASENGWYGSTCGISVFLLIPLLPRAINLSFFPLPSLPPSLPLSPSPSSSLPPSPGTKLTLYRVLYRIFPRGGGHNRWSYYRGVHSMPRLGGVWGHAPPGKFLIL